MLRGEHGVLLTLKKGASLTDRSERESDRFGGSHAT